MILRLFLSLAIAAVLLAILLWWGDLQPGELFAAVARLPLATYLTALALHAAIYAVRAARFAILLPSEQRPRFAGVLAASSAHNLAAYVLPAKSGEATLVVYLRSHSGVAASAGLATLLLSRLLDLATLLAIVGFVALALRGRLEPDFAALVPTLSAALLGGALAIAAISLRPDLLTRLAAALGQRLGLARTGIGRRLLEKADTVSAALRSAASGPALFGAGSASVAIWTLVFAFYAVLGRGAGLPADLGALGAAFGASLAVLFNLLPINGFAGFGTQEAGWKIGYVLLGVDGALALSSGFVVHLVQLANVVLFGLLGHLALPLLSHARAPEPE